MNNSIGQKKKNWFLDKVCPMLLYFLNLLFIVSLFLIFLLSPVSYLRIANKDNQELFSKKNVSEFQITHIHSVAKSLVKDFYEIHDYSSIIQNRMEYHDYGAGLPTAIDNGNFQIINETMVLSDLNYEFNEIRIMVGRYSDQKIVFTDEIITLSEIADPGQLLILKPGMTFKVF